MRVSVRVTSADELAGRIAPCVCKDPEADLLRDLIAAGWDQVDVSRVLWGNTLNAPTALVRHLAGQEARAIVRTRMRDAFPWLRLPPEGRP